MKKIFFLLLAICLVFGQAAAQTRVVGKVTSSDDGQPIAFATVVVKDATNTVATTADDGTYSIMVPSGSNVLIFSFMGYQSIEETINGRGTINATLIPDATMLQEAVVTTGYITEKRKNVSGSVTNLRSDELQLSRVDNLQRAMEGKAAGVQIIAGSGLPGSNMEVNIRGVSSISAGTTPLYIVDGVQVITGDNASYLKTTNAIAGINPDDIESIDILKDGASASIYGAQAANGVVIIKTKRGQKGKTRVSFSTKLGFDQLLNNIDILNSQQFVELTLEAAWNRYGNSSTYLSRFNTYQGRGWVSGNSGDFPNITYTNEIPYVDWMDAVTRNGFSQEYQLTISGGNDNTSFFLSGSYNDTQATTIFNEFNRATVRMNLDHKIYKWLDVRYSGSFATFFQSQPNNEGAYANPIRSASMTNPTNLIYNSDGTYNTNLEGSYYHNVVLVSDYNTFKGRTNKTTNSVSFVARILNGLEFTPSISIDIQDLSDKYYYDPRTPDGEPVGGRATVGNSRQSSLQTSHILTYNTVIGGNHRISALLGFEYKDYRSRMSSTNGIGFPTSYFKLISQAAEVTSWSETFGGYKMASLMGRLGYTFKDRYIFNFVLRRDGSSRFGSNNRFAYFPSVSGAWRIVDEPFMAGVAWLDDLKLKASYGVTGNSSIGNFASIPQFGGSGAYNGSPAIYPSATGNPDLTWESKYSLNLGVEASFFRNRASVGLDVFRDKTKDLLYNLPIPGTSGFYNVSTEAGASIPVNGGSLRNEGIELTVTGTPVRFKDFSWNINANFTWIRNEILSLYGGKQEITDTYRVGEPQSSVLRYQYAGVNPADGRPMYYAADGSITYNPRTEDRVWMAGVAPTFFGGVTNTISWKGLELAFLFQFQSGARRYFSDMTFYARAGSTGDRNQMLSQYDERWKQPGDVTWVPQPMWSGVWKGAGGSTRSFYSASSLHQQKTDFLKLKNIQLSYNLPKALVQKLRLEGVQVSVSAYNIWTTTPYMGFDPEFTGVGTSTSDFGLYPQSKNYTFTIKLDF